MKTCVVCGEQVAPEKIGVTCSFTCRAKLRERNRTPDWTRPLKVYPPELVSKVCGLYRSGMTIVEIQKELGMSYKLLHTILSRNLEEGLMKAAPRDQWGENNKSWKGSDVGYSALHKRVESQRGCPSICEVCGTLDADRYEWANLTGDYEDVNDYARMCVICHREYDNNRRKKTGKNTRPGGRRL